MRTTSATITVLAREYDRRANKTRIKVQTPEFTDWYWVSGDHNATDALELVRPVIERQLAEL
jgi:hypothetical protein